MPDDELPPAVAILNPKLEGSPYPCPHLSGCGVGYKLMQAFSISNGIATAELESMLDLVAVSIAADIVPMIDENITMMEEKVPYLTKVKYFAGKVGGTILAEKHGSEGFGYDPVFMPDGYDKSFAELGAEIKNRISHRAKAVKELVEYLSK